VVEQVDQRSSGWYAARWDGDEAVGHGENVTLI
jgi:hypothetical protein